MSNYCIEKIKMANLARNNTAIVGVLPIPTSRDGVSDQTFRYAKHLTRNVVGETHDNGT